MSIEAQNSELLPPARTNRIVGGSMVVGGLLMDGISIAELVSRHWANGFAAGATGTLIASLGAVEFVGGFNQIVDVSSNYDSTQ